MESAHSSWGGRCGTGRSGLAGPRRVGHRDGKLRSAPEDSGARVVVGIAGGRIPVPPFHTHRSALLVRPLEGGCIGAESCYGIVSGRGETRQRRDRVWRSRSGEKASCNYYLSDLGGWLKEGMRRTGMGGGVCGRETGLASPFSPIVWHVHAFLSSQ